MATLTDRIPEDKHLRLKKLAECQCRLISVNKLIALPAPIDQLEELAIDLLDFTNSNDLAEWLRRYG
jgi:Domain of unknown function (DUF4351)